MTDDPIVWIGGEHCFRLGLGELRALQRVCDAGPERLYRRLLSGDYMVDDLIEPIRLGLIGSGEMTASEAGPFVTGLVEKHPKMLFKVVAAEIMARSLVPMEGQDDEGKPEAASPTTTDDGTSPRSTETAQ